LPETFVVTARRAQLTEHPGAGNGAVTWAAPPQRRDPRQAAIPAPPRHATRGRA